MARDDPKGMRRDIRNNRLAIPQEHHSSRGDTPRNSGNFTRGSQLLNTQVLMWLGVSALAAQLPGIARRNAAEEGAIVAGEARRLTVNLRGAHRLSTGYCHRGFGELRGLAFRPGGAGHREGQ
jgi:hypothetical protein